METKRFQKKSSKRFWKATKAIKRSLTLLLIAFPVVSFGEVKITEIMYDPVGNDSGREWIEVFNSSDTGIELTSWFFFEGGVSHRISAINEGGETTLPFRAYAVIADNPEKFLIDFPGYPGLIFDSSFSLHNTGEELSIRNAEKISVDSVIYSSDWGGSGEYSLQLIDGNWSEGIPTPGAENSSGSAVSQGSGEGSGASGGSGAVVDPPKNRQIDVEIRTEKTILAGADTSFEGFAYGIQGESLEGARFLWNFGDGNFKEGKLAYHSYSFPGKYAVNLDVSSGGLIGVRRLAVEVKDSPLVISEVNREKGYIKLKNPSTDDLNIGWWKIRSKDQFFTIPKNTYILSKGEIALTSGTMGISVSDDMAILYPNGRTAGTYEPSQSLPPSQVAKTSVLAQEPAKKKPAGSVTDKAPDTVPEEVSEEDTVLGFSSGKDQEGATVLTETPDESYKWYLALLGVIVGSIGLILTIGGRPAGGKDEEIEKLVEEIEITDDTNIDDTN